MKKMFFVIASIIFAVGCQINIQPRDVEPVHSTNSPVQDKTEILQEQLSATDEWCKIANKVTPIAILMNPCRVECLVDGVKEVQFAGQEGPRVNVFVRGHLLTIDASFLYEKNNGLLSLNVRFTDEVGNPSEKNGVVCAIEEHLYGQAISTVFIRSGDYFKKIVSMGKMCDGVSYTENHITYIFSGNDKGHPSLARVYYHKNQMKTKVTIRPLR